MVTTVVKPDLPGSSLTWVGDTTQQVLPNENERVALMGTATWGPKGSDSAGTKLYLSWAEFTQEYGNDFASPGVLGVFLAFRGQDAQGAGGAGGVYFHRLSGAAAAASTRTFKNTADTDAFKLDAIYTGTRGNDLSAIFEVDPATGTNHRLRILLRGVEVERFVYTPTDLAGLADTINGRPSRWVKATSLVTGTALTLTAGTGLQAGNDGSTVTSTDYLDAQRALEFKDFGAVAACALTDVAVKAQLATWVRGLEASQRPVRWVFGGVAGETVDQAAAELNANGGGLRDPHFIRFGVGTWHDSVLSLDLSTAQLAPRIAGAMVARGERSALTRTLFGALDVVANAGPTVDDLRVGRDAGITMLRQVSNPDANVAISQGVTTFTAKNAPGRPYELFSEPRIVGLFDRVQRQIVQWGDDVVIGDLPVTDDTRNLVRKEIRKILDELETTGLAEPGSGFVTVDPPTDPSLSDAIPYEFGFKPSRTANFLIGNGRVR